MREGQGEIGSWVRLASVRGGSIWRWWLNLGVGHSLGGSIGSRVCGVISPVDEVGRSLGGFMARSRRCWGATCRCLDVRLELLPVLGCVIGEECVWERMESTVGLCEECVICEELGVLCEECKWFEVKIKPEMLLQEWALILRSTQKWFSIWPNFR